MPTRARVSAGHLTVGIVSCLALAAGAAAETFDYGIDAGIAETSNVSLLPGNTVSQTMAVADVDFDYKQQTRLLDASLKGNFSYIDYLQNAYDRQLLGRFDGSGRFALIPERLTWVVQDSFGQAVLDPFTPTTPNNLENVNYFSTGPDLALRLGSTGFFNASARYARTTYATSPFNSNRLQASIAAGLQLSARSTVSLNADNERVLFTNTFYNTDFNRTNAFVRYTQQGARTEFTADVGATRIKQGNDTNDGALIRLDATRKLSSAAKLVGSAGRTFTDASTSFNTLQSGAIGVVGAAPAAVTSDTYTSDYASLAWNYKRSRTTIDLSARFEKDNYALDPTLDVKRGGGELRLDRQVTRIFNAELLGRYFRTDYADTFLTQIQASPRFDDELIASVLTLRYGRGLEIKLRLEHDARVTSGFSNSYKDNRAFLTVGYRSNNAPPEIVDPGA